MIPVAVAGRTHSRLASSATLARPGVPSATPLRPVPQAIISRVLTPAADMPCWRVVTSSQR